MGGENSMNLDSILNETEEQEAQEVLAVVDLESAAEVQRRIAYFQEKMNEVDAVTEQQVVPFQQKIDKIREWGKQAKLEHEEKKAYYTNLLEQYLRQEVAKQLEAGKKPKKTLSLPYGKIALKKQQPEFKKDEAALLGYAKQSGFVRVKEETDWAELKKNSVVAGGKMYDMNGEAIPGVTVIERDEKFELKLD
jgi:Bacteriophage Mu Gam like protein